MNANALSLKGHADAQISLRRPLSEDGFELNKLISACPPLDENSVYCNLLQCTHFADTGCSATSAGKLVGFISGYKLPEKSDTLFIWQVAVASSERNQGLAGKMLKHILSRPSGREIKNIETTVTSDNHASRKMFLKLAHELNSPLEEQLFFGQNSHFAGQHEDEYLLRIGPFKFQPEPASKIHPYICPE